MSKSDKQLEAELEVAGHKPTTAAKTTTTKSTKTNTDADAGTEKITRARVPAGSKPSAALAIHIPDDQARYEATRLRKSDTADKATHDATCAAIDRLAKKVGEKAVNLLRHRASPDNVQVYTRIGLDQIISQGKVTSKQLVDGFASKYRPGTCRAQSNQLMSLFPALGIATREDRSTLSLNKDSVIVAQYRKATK